MPSIFDFRAFPSARSSLILAITADGDRYPGTTVGKVAAAFLQMLGFMFIPYALAIGLNEPTGGLMAEHAEGHFEAPAAAQEAPLAPAPGGASIFG